MRVRHKYVLVLSAVALVILMPAFVARLFGASIDLLAPLAGMQLFALLAFLFTMPASLILAIRAAAKKEWKQTGVLLAGLCVPVATWWLAVLTNGPGWEAVMGI